MEAGQKRAAKRCLEAAEELRELLTQGKVTTLPTVLKAIRNRAEQLGDPQHLGHHIALLFDDPNHRPPQFVR